MPHFVYASSPKDFTRVILSQIFLYHMALVTTVLFWLIQYSASPFFFCSIRFLNKGHTKIQTCFVSKLYLFFFGAVFLIVLFTRSILSTSSQGTCHNFLFCIYPNAALFPRSHLRWFLSQNSTWWRSYKSNFSGSNHGGTWSWIIMRVGTKLGSSGFGYMGGSHLVLGSSIPKQSANWLAL